MNFKSKYIVALVFLSALMLELGAWGNVSTTTMRAYSKEDMDIITSKMDGVK